jgi:hypothetical protein
MYSKVNKIFPKVKYNDNMGNRRKRGGVTAYR